MKYSVNKKLWKIDNIIRNDLNRNSNFTIKSKGGEKMRALITKLSDFTVVQLLSAILTPVAIVLFCLSMYAVFLFGIFETLKTKEIKHA